MPGHGRGHECGGALATVLTGVLGALLGAAVLATLLLSTGTWRWGAAEPATGAPPVVTPEVPPEASVPPATTVGPGQPSAAAADGSPAVPLPGGTVAVAPDEPVTTGPVTTGPVTTGPAAAPATGAPTEACRERLPEDATAVPEDASRPVVLRGCAPPAAWSGPDGYYEVGVVEVPVQGGGPGTAGTAWVLRPSCGVVAVSPGPVADGRAAEPWTARTGARVLVGDGSAVPAGAGPADLPDPGEQGLVVVGERGAALRAVSCVG